MKPDFYTMISVFIHHLKYYLILVVKISSSSGQARQALLLKFQTCCFIKQTMLNLCIHPINYSYLVAVVDSEPLESVSVSFLGMGMSMSPE